MQSSPKPRARACCPDERTVALDVQVTAGILRRLARRTRDLETAAPGRVGFSHRG
jgi:hypothetical protein